MMEEEACCTFHLPPLSLHHGANAWASWRPGGPYRTEILNKTKVALWVLGKAGKRYVERPFTYLSLCSLTSRFLIVVHPAMRLAGWLYYTVHIVIAPHFIVFACRKCTFNTISDPETPRCMLLISFQSYRKCFVAIMLLKVKRGAQFLVS